MHVELALQLRLLVSILNTTVKNDEKFERSYVHCGPFSKQWKLKHSPLGKLVSPLAVWFNQAHKCNAFIDRTHLKEKALHVTACLGIANFPASNGWVNRFKKHTTLFTELYQLRAGVLIQKTGKIIHY
jgi:hypothetical protein